MSSIAPLSSTTHPNESISPWDLKEFGTLHKVPYTDFCVQGETANLTDVYFHIYNKDGKALVCVQLSPYSFPNGYRWIDEIHKNLCMWPDKPRFWSDGNYIHIKRLTISGKDETERRQVAQTLLQILMEFAKRMNAAHRIYGVLHFCSSKRLYLLGMKYLSDEKNPTIDERVAANKVSKHEIATIYVPDECAKEYYRRIRRSPIFLT